MDPRHGELTVGELARRSGVPASTVRFYEREGLIHSRRTGGNQRRYARDTLRRIAFVRASQRLGIKLADIRDALSVLPRGRTPTQEDWALVSGRWHGELTLRIELLLKLRDKLIDCIGCGCLSLEGCALVNPCDVLGDTGPGACGLAGSLPETAAGRQAV
ncbi:redox-sensitive transcriptional activator SoxR [Streptomyces sp. NPDC048277]|uniref:redox-sensitive transcriptional activator SoxR n=1 Tax=Streptomyces sp. NPDC048277 TaxID=3155027 RepID=UPI0033EBC84F